MVQNEIYYEKVTGATPNTTLTFNVTGPSNTTFTKQTNSNGEVTWEYVPGNCKPVGIYTTTVTDGSRTATITENRTSLASCNSLTFQASKTSSGAWTNSITVVQNEIYYEKVTGATPNTTLTFTVTGPSNSTFTKTTDSNGEVTWEYIPGNCKPVGIYTTTVTDGSRTATITEIRTTNSTCNP